MKKILFTFFVLFLFLSLNAQVIIQMEKDGGVYKIPCLVNGAKMKMIFDTGASAVSMSKNMAEYLYENDYLKKENFRESGLSKTADGSIVNNMKIVLKDIEISGVHLSNVEAVVLESQNAPLLFGQSAIQKLGPIEINDNVLKILNQKESLSDEEIDELFRQANEYSDAGLDQKAIDIYIRLYNMDLLSDYGKYSLAGLCMRVDDASKALKIIDEIKSYDFFKENGINIYSRLGWISEENDLLDQAKAYYKLAFDFPNTSNEDRADYAYYIGSIASRQKLHREAATNYQMAIYCLELHHNLNQNDLVDECLGKKKNKKVSHRSDFVDRAVYYYFEERYLNGDFSNETMKYTMAKLAKNGNAVAIRMSNYMDFDWNRYLDNY